MSEITKVIFTGSEGSGKSLEMSRVAQWIRERNAKFRSRGLPQRPIVTNMKFSDDFMQKAEDSKVPVYTYATLEELLQYDHCDVFMDEISKYYDSHRWQDLSTEALTWITQGGKQGIKLYASCQDFSQVAKSFRTLNPRVFSVDKIAGSRRPDPTFPPIRVVWGFYALWRVDPKSFKGDDVTMDTIGWPVIRRITKKDCAVFDTAQRIIRPQAMPLEHIARYCPVEQCKHHTLPVVTHR